MALILFPQLYSDTLDRAALAQERAQRHRRTEEALRLARDCLYHRLVPLAKATGIAMGPLTPVTDLRFDGVAAADTVVPRLVLGQQAPQFTRDVWLIRASAVSTLDVMFSCILAEEQLPVNPSPSLFKSSVERLTAWRENPLHSLCVCVGAAWDSNCTAALGYYIMLVDAVPPDRLLPAPLLREPPPRPALLDKAPRLRQSGTIKSLGPPLSVSGKLRKSGTKKRSPPLDAHQLTLTDMADSSSRAKEQKRSALVAQMTEDSGQPAQKKQKGDGAAASEESEDKKEGTRAKPAFSFFFPVQKLPQV